MCRTLDRVQILCPRPISADFTLWLQGILDSDRIIRVLRALDNSVYLKAKNAELHLKALNNKVDVNFVAILLTA